MRNGLQYLYSIGVFLGVLFSSYLILSNENPTARSTRLGSPTYRVEANVDSAIGQLIQVDEALRQLPQRTPTEARKNKDPKSSDTKDSKTIDN